MIGLTEKQTKILWYESQGYTVKETALGLALSINTVREQRRRIKQKMRSFSVVLNIVVFTRKGTPKKTTFSPEILSLRHFKSIYNNPNGQAQSRSIRKL